VSRRPPEGDPQEARLAWNRGDTARGDSRGADADGPLSPQRMGDLDLRAVRYFLVLAEEMHYGRAARRLDLSRSGLSRAISALERQLALQLLVRSGHGLRLTAAGGWLARYGGVLLRLQSELQHELNELIATREDPAAARRRGDGRSRRRG
jgi:hypothetical protein